MLGHLLSTMKRPNWDSPCGRALWLLFSLIAASWLNISAAVATGDQTADATVKTSGASAPKKYTNLYRCDFKLTGASCVACVRRVGRMIRGQKGVIKADISIFKPYWGIVIYERDVTDMEKLYDVVKQNEKVKFEELDDQKIAEVPLIIIPKGLKAGAEPSKSIR